MFLVDTSVWIDFLRARDNPAVSSFGEILDRKLPYGITGVIYQEVLQGSKSEKDLSALKRYLQTQRFYHPVHAVESYEEAARIFFRCRRKGVTLRGSQDCLIARIAIEHDLQLLHNDRDFLRMARVIPELRLA